MGHKEMLLDTHLWLVRTPSCEVHRTCKTFPTYTILTMTPGELKKIYISGPRVRLAELETGGGLHVRWGFRIVFPPPGCKEDLFRFPRNKKWPGFFPG